MSLAAVKQQEQFYKIFDLPQYEKIDGENYDAKAMAMARAAMKDNGATPVISREESEHIAKALFDGNPNQLTDAERRAARKIAFDKEAFPFSTDKVRQDFIKSLRRKDPDALCAPEGANIWGLNLLAILAAEEAVHNNKGFNGRAKAITREEAGTITQILQANGISGTDRETAKFIAKNYTFTEDSVKTRFKEAMGIAFSR